MLNKSTFSLSAYAGNSNSNGILSEEEFLSFLIRSKNGDKSARNQLLMANLGLILSIAKHVTCAKTDFDNLVVDGCIRFLELINDYNPQKCKLSTYIWRPALQAMNEGIEGYDKKLGAFIRSYNGSVEYLSAKSGRKPSEEEIAGFMGISMKVFKNRLMSLENHTSISFDAPVSSEYTDSASFLDIYQSDDSADSSTSFFINEDRRSIRSAWNRLSDSERKILTFRIGQNGEKMSLRDAEKKSGVCKETIRCRENKAKQHFQQLLGEYGVMVA